MPVPPWSLAALRMVPFARALWREGHRDGLAVARLRFGVRGWNGADRSPVADARWALEQLRARFPNVPIGLVGHSMGGRTALAVAHEVGVLSVVGLAPWLEPGDRPEPLRDRRLLIAHGTLDRTTSPGASARFADQARHFAIQVTYVSVTGDGHPMLRRAGVWHALAAGFTAGALLDRASKQSNEPEITNVVIEALAGRQQLTL
jgi:dienelactone hydrolase